MTYRIPEGIGALAAWLFFVLMLTCCWSPALCQDGAVLVEARGNRQMRLAVEVPRGSTLTEQAPLMARELGDVISFDLNLSGVVAAETREILPFPEVIGFGAVDFSPWAAGGFDLLARGEYTLKGDELTVELRLFEVHSRKLMLTRRYFGAKADLRRFAHAFSDEILLAMTGERGSFSSKVAFVTTKSGNKEIAVMEWDGYNVTPVTSNGSINLNPDFSPDGSQLIFTSYKSGNPDLYRRALGTSTDLPVSRRKGLNITATWSPGGGEIALTLSKDGDSEIYTINRDGANPMRLTVNPAIDVSPAWSPDGRQIAFVSDRLGRPQIFVMDANGGNVRRLTPSGNYNVTPRWSPKGDRITYARMQNGTFQVYTINADGSGDTQLTSTGSNENPAWSPDGRLIMFASKRNGSPEALYVMRADGSSQVKVSRGTGAASQPAWARQ